MSDVHVLFVKLGATGDVVRTTTLLHRFPNHVSWITDPKNLVLLKDLRDNLRCIPWHERGKASDEEYDLVINLEDSVEVGQFLRTVKFRQLFGAYLADGDRLCYSDDSRAWFDLSLISVFGREKADALKLQNRRTYQDLLFEALGFRFENEPYWLPEPPVTDLSGDVAIAPEAGPVWPMKNWAHYEELGDRLRAHSLKVNRLPKRDSLLEHLADIRNHRCLVGGDSLPMHLALGSKTPCVSLFTCTSPWEIHDYGLQTKLVSPLLSEFFYKRGFDERATTAIGLDEVLAAVMDRLDGGVGR